MAATDRRVGPHGRGRDTAVRDPWFFHPVRRPAPRLRLFCLPHAGGGASGFSTWADLLPADVELWPVQPPGRQDRAAETPFDRIEDVVAALFPALEAHLDLPWALFGHSVGAHVAFEVARAARTQGQPEPSALIVSARRAPQLTERNTRLSRLDDAALLALTASLHDEPGDAAGEHDATRLALPALRADTAMADHYRYRPEPPLHTPILALGGIDDPTVTVDELLPWQNQTAGGFGLRMFPGGHFFTTTARREVLRAITSELAQPGSGGA